MTLHLDQLMAIFHKTFRDLNIPTAEEVFANKTPSALIDFFDRIKCNYYIILFDKSVTCSFEHGEEGVMRVECDKGNRPYVCLYHKSVESLINEQEEIHGAKKTPHGAFPLILEQDDVELGTHR